MKTKTQKVPVLEQGQIYKLADSKIEIVLMGKRLVHFKQFQIASKVARIQLRSISDLGELLTSNGAKLMKR